jgi:hypothetical protein
MYAQQASIDPALAALLQTAQMVTPDQTPTVAAQVAQAAQQKMQPQGIAQGMPQARQDFQQAMPSMMRNMQQQQMQQMIKQAMQPQPAGIEGLPAPNMQNMAEGGVVGFAGDEFGSYVSDPDAIAMDEVRSAEFQRKRREDYQRQKAANEEYRANIARQKQEEQQRAQVEFLEQAQAGGAAGEAAAALRRQMTTSSPQVDFRDSRYRTTELRKGEEGVLEKIGPALLNKKPEIQFLTSSPAQTAPTGVAALPAIKEPGGMDRDRIETAGSAFLTQAEKDIAAAQAIEARRKETMKSMPDLNQRGIAALEAAEQERKRLLGIDRSDDSRRRWAGVFRGWGGDRDAYDRIVGGIANRDALANQAQLGFEQARIKEMQAQQARALGEFDRERALLKESADMKNKARDDMLRAQQITAQVESGELTSRTNVYDAQMRARDAELNRDAQRKLEEYRRQTQLMKPKEQGMVERLEALKLSEITGGKPETATVKQKIEAAEYGLNAVKGAGKPDRTVLTYDQAADNVAKFLDTQAGIMEMAAIKRRAKDAGQPEPSIQDIRSILIQRELQGAGSRFAGQGSPTGAPQGTVDKNNPLLK